jgi:hypothetical protein
MPNRLFTEVYNNDGLTAWSWVEAAETTYSLSHFSWANRTIHKWGEHPVYIPMTWEFV